MDRISKPWPLWARISLRLAWGAAIILVAVLLGDPPTPLLLGMVVLFLIAAPLVEWLRSR